MLLVVSGSLVAVMLPKSVQFPSLSRDEVLTLLKEKRR